MSQNPGWYRGLQIILGIIAIILAIAVWMYISFAVLFMVFLFGFSLMFIGFAGIASGFAVGEISGWRRALGVILGIISVFISFMVIFYPSMGISVLILLLGIGLLISGVLGIVQGATDSVLPGWQRALYIIFGILIFILSFYVIANPTLGTILYIPILPVIWILPGVFLPTFGIYYVIPSIGYLLLVVFLSLGLIIRGIQAIISGARGTA